MRWVKKYFLTNRVKSQKEIQRSTINYNQSKQIGILFAMKEKMDLTWIKEIKDYFEKEGKEVSFIAFKKKKYKENPLPTYVISYTLKDLSITGKINSQEIKNFIHTSFDYLMCVDKIISPEIAYIIQKSQAKCRAGVFNEELSFLFEFMLIQEEKHTIQEKLIELVNQLKKIRYV
jgi:hypothetical protein